MSAKEQEDPKPEDLFGEVISCYSQQQAIEDGFLEDLGRLSALNFRVIATGGFMELDKRLIVHALIISLNVFSTMPSVDMIVFKSDIKTPQLEDEHRTAIMNLDGTPKKLYVKKDGCSLTFMLAEEY